MARFRIDYLDPETREAQIVYSEHEDSFEPMHITAREWAEDLAYTLADKGHYTVTEEPQS